MIFIFSILLWGVAGVTYVLGAEGDFVPLVGIPGLKTGTTPSLTGYLNALYIASISIAAFLAVIKIIFAGVKYMLTDVVTTKGDAKKDIKGALLGLLIVIGAVLILNTINPNLTYLDVLKLDQVDINSSVVTQTRTEQSQCVNGTFTKTNANPNGTCVETFEVPGGGDYSESPGEGAGACTGIGTYNSTTNKCEKIVVIQKVPEYILEQNTLLYEDDINYMNTQLNIWCAAAFSGTSYDPVNKSCVEYGAI